MPRKNQKAQNLKIEYVELEMVQRWKRNPKNHDLEAIRDSIRRFGFVQPIVIDAGSERLVAGHGRLDVLLTMKNVGENPPERIVVNEKTGDWMVPVLSGVKFANEADAEAYLVADNRLVESGGWDEKILVDVLNDVSSNLSGVGFSSTDIVALNAYVASLEKKIELVPEMAESSTPKEEYALAIICSDCDEFEKLFQFLKIKFNAKKKIVLFSDLSLSAEG